MQKSVRQSMAWLHSWLGLSFGWLLFAIFLTGSASYYRHEISLWMQPAFATQTVQQDTAIRSAYQYLQKNAADAEAWYIQVANPHSPVNILYWQKPDQAYESRTLDATTGQEQSLAATQGGDFFYRFHYQLFGFPTLIGRLIVTSAALLMFIILISGIITHKKFFADFFTLRAFKGQRSYLDFHNVSSVIALPFFLTITFTGLAVFFYLFIPSGLQKLYPDNYLKYFEEIQTTAPKTTPSTAVKSSMISAEQLIQLKNQHWGNSAVDIINVKQPYTQLGNITLTELKDETITRRQAQLNIASETGKILENHRNESAVATLNAGILGLHIARFADPLLRLGLFFSGILGCAMIASGLLLWSLKRQMQKKTDTFHFGHYLVNRLNISAILGLPIAMLSYLYANRLAYLIKSSSNFEIKSFFYVWLGSLILACVTPKQQLWQRQLKVWIIAAALLPLINAYYLYQANLIHSFSNYWIFLRVDLMLWVFALFGCYLHQNIQPIQARAVTKIQRKQKPIQD